MTATTWDPAHTDAGFTMSNGDLTLTATSSSSLYSVSNDRKTIASGGKFYVEFEFTGMGGSAGAIAFADASYSPPNPIFASQSFVAVTNGFESCWGNNGAVTDWHLGTHSVDLAVDLDSTPNRYFSRVDNGIWSDTGDPAAETGGLTPGTTPVTDLRIAVSMANSGQAVTMHAASSSFSRTPPTGYSPWDSTVSDHWATIETPDTFAAAGYPGAFGVLGNLAVFETPDLFSGAGYPNLIGVLSVLESRDSFSAFAFQPLTGVLSVTERPDIFVAHGLGQGEDGTWISTEAVDIFSAIGNTPIAGTLTTTETADRFLALGAGVIQVRRRRVLIVS